MKTHNTPNSKPAKASHRNISTTKPGAKLAQIARHIEFWIWANPWLEVALIVSIFALILGGYYAQ